MSLKMNFSISRWINIFGFLFLFMTQGRLSAQEDLSEKARINKQYFKSYVLDTRDVLISPVKWKGGEWLLAGGVIGSAGLLVTQDSEIRDFFQRNVTETSSLVTKHGLERLGSGVYSMPTMGLFYLHGLVFKNERTKKVGLLGVKSFAIAGALVNIPKYLINRHRPFHDDPADPYVFEGPFSGHYYKSMPSGHTTAAFAVATIVAEEYKDKPIVPILSYTLATLVGLSRIHDDKHWASDVFVGALFGWSIGKLIYRTNNWKVGDFSKSKQKIPVGEY